MDDLDNETAGMAVGVTRRHPLNFLRSLLDSVDRYAIVALGPTGVIQTSHSGAQRRFAPTIVANGTHVRVVPSRSELRKHSAPSMLMLAASASAARGAS